ncbi:MAG TPA: hypothetical protein VFI27_16505 [candidate division Zixibacteria bacterium]|nr:hypothetical protein [candidate division Zixibacteria bacterium]
MQGNMFALPICVPGTLTADVSFRFQAPFDMQLVKVTAGCDNALTFILDIGTAADLDAYLDAVTVTGVTATTTEYDRDDFVDDQYPHISDGDEVVVTIDYNGGDGNDSANVSVVLWFYEG